MDLKVTLREGELRLFGTEQEAVASPHEQGNGPPRSIKPVEFRGCLPTVN